jgi:nucleotide-binding universal stress UspA family protein
MFKTMLIPVDGSPYSDEALKEGVKLAKTLGASVTLLHVMETPVMLYGAGDAVAYQTTFYDELRRKAEGILECAKKLARQAGAEVNTRLVQGARPAEVIMQLQNEYDLIVMGTHGRKGMSRWWVGSVAEGVLRRATQPCLIVHSKEAGQPSS